jgi:glycosyltransferase involved in cell wall biosynthesis
MKTYKADLHVHSSFSNKPTYWALRKFNCPESFTSPEFIYKTAKQAGMDFVTITDHNTIGGALQIAHLPDVFISVEVTAYFPEDGCKVHMVVLDICEAVYQDIMQLRKNIYELVSYLSRNNIVHFIAHPLYAQNEKLNADHIEKMILLFQVFEVKNGSRAPRFNRFMEKVLDGLTPALVEHLADKHNLEPVGEQPWFKAKVGGSDDHSGIFIARAHTAAPEGKTKREFIGSISQFQTCAAGEDGDPLTLAHSLYGIAHSFYRGRFNSRKSGPTPFIKVLLNNYFDAGNESLSFRDKLRFFIRKNLPEFSAGYEGRSFEEILDKEARRLLNDRDFLAVIGTGDRNRKIFAVTSYLANRMIYIYTERLTRISYQKGFFDLVNSLSTIGLVHLLASPYYLAFHHQHRGKSLMGELEGRFGFMTAEEKKEKIALFTDTLHEINGVAITIRRLVETAKSRGVELTVITSSMRETSYENGVMNFRQVGDFVLPEYPELKLSFPPLLDVIDYFEREGFTRIHVSTPGSIGLIALLIAKLMDIPISGTYHTDIPRYVRSLTSDELLENAAWQFMIWFYNQLEEVMVPSTSTRKQLIEHGLPAGKAKPLPRWVDTRRFNPASRDEGFWKGFGIADGIKFLYVGRVSREKNLELLVNAFREIIQSGFSAHLVIIGDGPYRKEMEENLRGYPATFAGFLEGDSLSRGYASSDVFVFPSTTDTFGNVVLEAQASGLPVIVSDEGGPKELMRDGVTGIVVRADDKDSLVEAMLFFLRDPDARLQHPRRPVQVHTSLSALRIGASFHIYRGSCRCGCHHGRRCD